MGRELIIPTLPCPLLHKASLRVSFSEYKELSIDVLNGNSLEENVKGILEIFTESSCKLFLLFVVCLFVC